MGAAAWNAATCDDAFVALFWSDRTVDLLLVASCGCSGTRRAPGR
ncbi:MULTISPECIES: hypothetical protein [Actinosynnema]|nr:hypothetical protein [Actinosynnema pretiosum]